MIFELITKRRKRLYGIHQFSHVIDEDIEYRKIQK